MFTSTVRLALIALVGLPLGAFAQRAAGDQTLIAKNQGPAARSSANGASTPIASGGSSDSSDSSVSSAESAAPAVLSAGALAPIVVTAQRGPQPLAEAIPQTTRFSRHDIDDSTATDLPGLLTMAPGAQVIRTGPPGSNAVLSLRGGSATQSLVLIDGMRVDSVSLGQIQLGQIPLSAIDHVEIVNGDVSALYGSGAMGGVVQVFTKDGGRHPPRFGFSAGYGSYHTQTQQAGVNGALDKDGKTTFSVSVARSKDDGFPAIDSKQAPNVNPAADGYLNETVAASLRHTFDRGWDAGVRYFESNGKVAFDNAYGVPTDVNVLYSKVRIASVFANGKLTDGWTMHVTAGLGDDRAVDQTNGIYNNRFDTDNRQLTWQNDFKLAAQQKLQLGYERLEQRLESDMVTAPERTVNSVYAGYTARFGANQIQANVRRDQYSDFGGANTYYFGYGFDFTEHWKATASYSAAFRAPSFDDLYFPGSGNPSIRPERSHSIEAALQYASDTLGLFRLTAFQTRYADLIKYLPTQGGLFYIAENADRAKVQGLEGSWSGRVGKTELRAALTMQNPVDEASDTDLNQRARHFASFSARRSWGAWRLGGEWIVGGPHSDSGVSLGGFGLVNLSARYDMTKAWYVSAHIDNLFDKHYELAYTYNTPRRGAFITIGWQEQ